ncbi:MULTISPECIES: hypothetical protein [unclassified Enterococcus]|uniref:hypothetical protein n=1 Tax=unclassified Enterococcus TaxID=2608891 RepID=UPI000B69713A|nr:MULTISPECIES: hypothetical protein [unclassified Enterococcus]OTO65570.1 hypothetical protein A5865_003634 [Enterococcus sp. 12E11_DIV0728]OUZ13436.1 hypothetical protein A5868_003639 [Enterococcus sp. 12F9_DIV0723]
MSDYINWWESNKETGLEDLNEQFLKLFPKADFLPSIYHPILYKYLKNDQIKHWNNDVFSFSKNKIEEIESGLGKDAMSSTLLANFHLLVYAYESLLDIEERIILMNRFKGSEELKAKIFSISLYNDLLNTAFSNILKLFIEFQSVIEKKNLYQKNLRPQIECLNKRGYSQITNLADSNIRNAISHGGVKADGSKMIFSYREGPKYLTQESTVYQFKDSLLQLYDGVSAIVLSWINYLCEENITYNEVYQNLTVHEDTSLFFERLSMSTLLTSCDKVYQLDINNDTGKRQHVNVEYTGVDLDIDSRIFLGLYSAERVFQLRELSPNDTVMVSFHSPRVITSFFTVKGIVLNDLTNGTIELDEAWKRVVSDKNVMMFPINDEKRNEFEDSFRYYPDIETEDYRITEIEDISVEDKKRFKAVVYLKRAKRPNHVKSAVEEIVSQLKILENYGFSSNKVKHGTMDADILYIVLYKQELRRGKDRALFPNNNNFIAQIQYDVEMTFPIRNGLVDPHLKLRREKEIEYNWNPNF